MVALALTVFGWNLPAEPHFVDESAYISQSFYADLWLTGHWDDPTWLTYGGYDLPPLPKYSIGIALRAAGYRRPGPSDMIAWYQNTSRQFVSKDALVVARCPSVLFGAMGCLAIYAIGMIGRDRRVGWVAALLLMANPLYAMHARRAMSDVYAESLILATLAVGLWGWKRLLDGKPWFWPVLGIGFGSGILGGLATLAKLNGSLALFILGSWLLLGVALEGFSMRRKLLLALSMLVAGVVSFGTFAGLNPFLFAHPPNPVPPMIQPVAALGFWGRAKVVADHRVDVSNQAQSIFPKDALGTPLEKVEAVIVQGFGRFGPFGPRGWTDSTIRYDWKQDRGALIWLPIVCLGGFATWKSGLRQYRVGEPLTAWAIVAQALVALVIVTAFIPLAWDRYFLSIQPGFALLASFGLVGAYDRVRSLVVRKRPEEEV